MKGGKWTSTDYEILDKLAVNRIAAREQMIENAPCYMCRASLGRGKRHSCRRCGRTICGDPNCGEKYRSPFMGRDIKTYISAQRVNTIFQGSRA